MGPAIPTPSDAIDKCLGQGNKKLCLLYVSYTDSTLTDSIYGGSISVTPSTTDRYFAAPSKSNPMPSNCYTAATWPPAV